MGTMEIVIRMLETIIETMEMMRTMRTMGTMGPGGGREPGAPGGSLGPRGVKRKLYSAVPGRSFLAVRPYQAQGEGELSLSKGEPLYQSHTGPIPVPYWFPPISSCPPESPPSPILVPHQVPHQFHTSPLLVHTGAPRSPHSALLIPPKTVLLQKKDNEGFGFVLRGAKAQTPIEEFTPTPAFPALQYLESVDEGGVAWRAGLRMGDFLIEVNGQNVVKVGHRQVVNMIRQGGNSLVLKVVMVTRHPEAPEGPRRRAGEWGEVENGGVR
uniref:PDZ domain-containing protein n=1 Tax=Cairina moschata TaxID=8855 RepID=A0A8C3GLV8_CAIMO